MKRLFIHNPLFRLLSPIFSGGVVYLLILLINNNVDQLKEQFLGEELYLCIGLSFIIQELARLLLWLFNKLTKNISFSIGLTIQVIGSLFMSIVVVTITIYYYYKIILGFSPSGDELWMFNMIFSVLTLIYISLHISHQYLHKINTEKLNNELILKEIDEDEFLQFKEGINSELLFDSFEALIVLIREQENKFDDLIEHLASTYRYILSRKKQQLVDIEEEITALNHLISLFNYLPFRNISLENEVRSNFLFVPGCLLKLIENIVRSTINSQDAPLEIKISETDEFMQIQYDHNDTINKSFGLIDMETMIRVYKIYSLSEITFEESTDTRIIRIPKLQIKS
jgi:hypothetical protein